MSRKAISVGQEVYYRLALLRAREMARRGEEIDWNDFFRLLLQRERQRREALSWAYSLAIFILVTWILLWPVYIYAPNLIPLIWAIGFVVAVISVYILTPLNLREYKPLKDAPPEILDSLKELATKAGLRKPPALTIAETEEINAMAYLSLAGGRVCLTRGLLKAYEDGKLSLSEVQAIIAHEVGHLKLSHPLKFGLAMSWADIFEYIGNETIKVGEEVARISDTNQGWGEVAIAFFGLGIQFFGAGLLLISKLASALCFHLSRKSEFEADDLSVELTHPEHMAAALAKIEAITKEIVAEKLRRLPYPDRWQLEPEKTNWVDRLWDTHPPISIRVERQKGLAAILRRLEEIEG